VADEMVIGWDVGGAHLKAARLDPAGRVAQVVQLACPLWQGLPRLRDALDQALAQLGPAHHHLLTMTGEMADLFPDRPDGVRQLVAAVGDRVPPDRLRVYAGGSGFLAPEAAVEAPDRVASANWVASAALVAARLPAALLLDIGSTTTDLIPVRGGRVLARGADDTSRMVGDELVYRGVVRTPVMAVAQRVPFAGEWVPLMAEYFATMGDVYRLTGQLPAGADLHPAADGGEKTEVASARRLARMIGRDLHHAPLESWRELARWLAGAQRRTLEEAAVRLLSRAALPEDAPVVGAGSGRFVAAELARGRGRPYLEFADLLPPGTAPRELVSDCAPAVAVGWLGRH
jgi:(4-(4-[2-(gamma-L-glutamylamino)ethyl]phenoxymethyl)furan-2-yl)methanamine synthase